MGPNVQSNPLPAHRGMAINSSPTLLHTLRAAVTLAPNCLLFNIIWPPVPKYPLIQVPTRPAYNNNVVPWRYPTMTSPTRQESTAQEVTNIAKAGGVTRSGRMFAPEGLQGKDLTLEKKDKVVEAPKKVVTKEEATNFLKLIRHSEYKMLDQMNKMPTQISLLSLLINSKIHRNLLLKVLEDADVAQDITPKKFDDIISNITESRHLSFSKDEVPVEG
ncbi:hypothetical protein CR513_33002, partial [Mucuna pruriens]